MRHVVPGFRVPPTEGKMPERMAQYRAETPLRRNGTAEEVAAAVLFLAGDQIE